MSKYLSLFVIVAVLLTTNPVFAKLDKSPKYAPDSEVALEDGTYDVEGKPNLKVHVSVYKTDARSMSKQKPGTSGGLTLECNIPDIDSASFIPTTGWHLPSSVTYRLNVASTPSVVKNTNLPTIASRSFSAWSSAVGGAVQFSRGADTSTTKALFDSQNIVAWGRTSNSALAITYTWYDANTGLVSETDTIFNSNVTWAWSNASTWVTAPGTTCAYQNIYDAQNILTHETGHWMGLDDTYTTEFTNNTMFGYGSKTETKKNSLSTGDILGVQNIY
jgi:hypothetical protein